MDIAVVDEVVDYVVVDDDSAMVVVVGNDVDWYSVEGEGVAVDSDYYLMMNVAADAASYYCVAAVADTTAVVAENTSYY